MHETLRHSSKYHLLRSTEDSQRNFITSRRANDHQSFIFV